MIKLIKLLIFRFLTGFLILNDFFNSKKRIGDDHSSNKVSEMKDKTLFSSLVRGEVTQEVKEMRASFYKVLEVLENRDKAKNQKAFTKEWYSNIKEKNNHTLSKVKSDTSDGLTLYSVIFNNFSEKRIKVEYTHLPLLDISEYIDQIHLKKDGEEFVLDVFFIKKDEYFERKEKILINNLESSLTNIKKFKVNNIKNISFTTNDRDICTKSLTFYNFSSIEILNVLEMEPFLILKLKCNLLTKKIKDRKYHNDDIEKKYKEKLPRKETFFWGSTNVERNV